MAGHIVNNRRANLRSKSSSVNSIFFFNNALKVKKEALILGTRKAEVLNSLIMKITANENDTNDILQTFPELSKRLQYVVCIVFIGCDFHHKKRSLLTKSFHIFTFQCF